MLNTSLSKNPLLANIQLFMWLLFYPDIWKEMVSKIDSILVQDFALSNLNSKHWKNPTLLYLLRLIYVFAPLFIGTIVVLFLSGFNLALHYEINYNNTLVRGMIYVIVLGILGGIVSGITISVAFSYIIITIGGLLIGTTFLIAEDLLWYKSAILVAIFSVSIASSILLKLNTDKNKLSSKTSIFLSLIAILAASIVGLIIYLSAASSYFLFEDYFDKKWQSQLIGITFGIWLIFFWATRSWSFSGTISVVSGIVIAILFSVPDERNPLWNPVIGSVFNSFVFSLAFALPYLLAKYIFNVQVGIIAGLLGSCGMYVYFFIASSSDLSIIPLSITAMFLGLSHQWWFYTISINSIKKQFNKITYLFIMLEKNNLKQNVKELKQWFHGISLELAITTNTSDKDIVKIDSSAEQIVKIEEPAQKIDNPYITGVPLSIKYNKNLFVGRIEIVKRLELLLKNQPSPPILLYGQRRIGKSSLLNFLPALLPKNYKSLRISFQGPIALSANHGNFFYNVARALGNSARDQKIDLPKVKREDFQDDPSTTFDEWLDEVETVIKNSIVLVFDEFEALEDSFQKGNINRDFVLSIFRDIIQNRIYFKIVFAGLHQLTVFSEWDNYFINAESVYLSYLEQEEARQLIEKSIQISYTEEAIEYVLYLTRHHPALLQLLCKEIIILKNSQTLHYRYNVQKSDVDVAIPNALKTGTNFFSYVVNRSSIEQNTLRVLAENITLNKETLLEQCKQEENLINLEKSGLIEQTSTGDYRFQIEMIRRWIVKK
ncbi:ATP-binding protein [Candidatus Halobeggiatoa sp. HSG11]|nr:ATP-binding protein [Candidatus Halobeggiatoa sp. HSG11]